jgi:hypothetical protein
VNTTTKASDEHGNEGVVSTALGFETRSGMARTDNEGDHDYDDERCTQRVQKVG